MDFYGLYLSEPEDLVGIEYQQFLAVDERIPENVRQEARRIVENYEMRMERLRARKFAMDGAFGAGKQSRMGSDTHNAKMAFLARKLSEDDWGSLQHVLRGGMEARGGNDPSDPGQMTARGSSTAETVEKQHAHDAKDQLSFDELFPDAEPVRNMGNFGVPEPRNLPVPTVADAETFHQFFHSTPD